MQTIKNFFSDIFSIGNKDFYRGLPKRTCGSGMKFLLGFSFLVSIVITAAVVAFLGEKGSVVVTYADIAVKEMIESFPADLSITIGNGKITKNIEAPVTIDVPQSIKKFTEVFSIDHLLTFDEKASIENFKTYRSLALITDKHIAYYSKSTGGAGKNSDLALQTSFVSIQDALSQIGTPIVVTQAKLQDLYAKHGTEIIQKLPSYIRNFLIIISPVMMIFFMLKIFLKGLLFLLFGVTLFWIFAKFWGKVGWKDWKDMYVAGMYLLPLPIVYELISEPFHFEIPFVFSLLFFAQVFLMARLQQKVEGK